MEIKTLRFITPQTSNVSDGFGELFKSVELPTLLKEGQIDNITFTQVADFDDMSILSEIDVDITALRKIYQQALNGGVSESVINTEIFEKFVELIKNGGN